MLLLSANLCKLLSNLILTLLLLRKLLLLLKKRTLTKNLCLVS